MKKLTDLSEKEIRQIVQDMFSPQEITNIVYDKEFDQIHCTIKAEFETLDDGKRVVFTASEDILLSNPFDSGEDSILEDDDIVPYKERLMFKQFCFVKGIYETDVITNNPYLQEEED